MSGRKTATVCRSVHTACTEFQAQFMEPAVLLHRQYSAAHVSALIILSGNYCLSLAAATLAPCGPRFYEYIGTIHEPAGSE